LPGSDIFKVFFNFSTSCANFSIPITLYREYARK
jgi:hypothetical protein